MPQRARPQPQPHPRAGRGPAPPSPAPSPAGPVRPQTPAQAPHAERNLLPPGARPPAVSGSPNLAPPAAAGDDAGSGYVMDDSETTNVQPLDDDDVVIVPAAPISSLGHQTHHRYGAAPEPYVKSLRFRRTAIPVLLTTSAILLAVVGLKFVVHPDSVLATLPPRTLLTLFGAAAVLLIVAALNMAQVRQQLAATRSARDRKR